MILMQTIVGITKKEQLILQLQAAVSKVHALHLTNSSQLVAQNDWISH